MKAHCGGPLICAVPATVMMRRVRVYTRIFSMVGGSNGVRWQNESKGSLVDSGGDVGDESARAAGPIVSRVTRFPLTTSTISYSRNSGTNCGQGDLVVLDTRSRFSRLHVILRMRSAVAGCNQCRRRHA